MYVNRLILVAFLYACVCRAAIASKRHLTNQVIIDPSEAALNRMQRSPTTCRSTCVKLNRECSNTCYPPDAYLLPNKKDNERYQCFEECLNPESQLYTIPETCVPLNNTSGIAPRKLGTNEIAPQLDASHLTTWQRCQLQGYVNSWVCDFENKHPIEAEKVFAFNRKQFSLCSGGKVYSGESGLFMYEVKSFVADEGIEEAYEDEFNIRTKKSIIEGSVRPRAERTAGNSRRGNSRTKRQASPGANRKTLKHICPTNTKIESPGFAVHKETGEKVSLYFHRGYSQWFEVGKCASTRPYRPVSIPNGSGTVRCGQAFTLHMAMFVIETSRVREVRKYKNCNTIPSDPLYKVCHDWVYLPSHCKLFIE